MTAGSREKKGCITCTPLPNWWYISRHCTSLPCGILFTANSVFTVEDVYRLVEQRSLWSYRKILLRKSSRCGSAFCSAPSRYAQTSTATVARSPAQSGTPRTRTSPERDVCHCQRAALSGPLSLSLPSTLAQRSYPGAQRRGPRFDDVTAGCEVLAWHRFWPQQKGPPELPLRPVND